MLQRLLFITLTLCSLTATAQWQQTGSKVRYVNGLGIPTKDTAAGVAADSSQILIRPQDSALYIKYKRTWVKVGGGSVSGTTNYIPKFTASTTLGNSQIFDNGTGIGIGTASPATDLQISRAGSSTIRLTNTSNSTNMELGISTALGFIGTQTNNAFALNTNNVERIRITSGGNVGINQTAPAAQFVVNGTALINTNTDNGVDKLQVSGSMSVGSIKSSGNVGIFNSSPFYALSVGDGTSTRQVVINGLNSGTAGGSSIAVQANSLTTIMFGNKSNIIGGAYDGQPVFGFGGSTNSLQFYNFNTTVTSAMISSGNRFLIGTTTDNNTDRLLVNGSISGIGMKQAYVAKTAAYTATTDDYFIDCTANSFTVTLYAASGNAGRILIIKNSGAGTITIDGNASETIDGSTIKSLLVQYDAVQIMCDGTNWKIISNL